MLSSSCHKSSVCTLGGRLLEDWKRARNEKEILYYINHKHSITQWDHPEYVQMFDELLSKNSVRYAAYRMACKLRHIQKKLKFEDVSLQCLASSFDCAGLRSSENSDIVEVKDIERVVLYAYRSTFKGNHLDLSLYTDLIVNLLLNAYDENRTGNLQVIKCKVLLVILCGGRLQEKHRYLFHQVADHNNCCTRRRLGKLLHCFTSVAELLSEQLSFGISLVPATVDSCFHEIESDIGVTEEAFLDWMTREPQSLVWWSTLHRLSAAETVFHDIKCSVCKKRPFSGFRYQCLKCVGFNMCQNCFFSGKTSRQHKGSHPIQEYCHELTGKEWRRSLIKMFRHRLTKSPALKPRFMSLTAEPGRSLRSLLQDTTYFPRDSEVNLQHLSSPGTELASRTICESAVELHKIGCTQSTESRQVTHTEEEFSQIEPIISPPSTKHQILSVIKQLEDSQKKLICRFGSDSKSPSIISEHTNALQTQIDKLKFLLMDGSPQNRKSRDAAPSKMLTRKESTPVVNGKVFHLSLSPIAAQFVNENAILDNKENHYAETQKHQVVISSTANSDLEPEEAIHSPTLNDESLFRECSDSNLASKETSSLSDYLNWTEISTVQKPPDSTSSSDLAKLSETDDSNFVADTSSFSFVRHKNEPEDTMVREINHELDRLMDQLDQVSIIDSVNSEFNKTNNDLRVKDHFKYGPDVKSSSIINCDNSASDSNKSKTSVKLTLPKSLHQSIEC